MGYLTSDDVRRLGDGMRNSEYGQYLPRLVGSA